MPLCFKDEIWVRSHYDTITIAIPDAPAPDEIVLVGAVATRGTAQRAARRVAKEAPR